MSERPAVRAGSWYPKEFELLDLLKDWDAQIEALPTETIIKSIIVPHAGYQYSGFTAAIAYKALASSKSIKRLIILGPLHQYHRQNVFCCFYSQFSSVNTPIGSLQIDGLPESLRNNPYFSQLPANVDLGEHSIELQYPLIKYFMPNVSVLPLLVRGDFKSLEKCSYYISELLLDKNTALVISTDFSHYGRRFSFTPDLAQYSSSNLFDKIDALNEEGLTAIASNNPSNFINYIERTENTICGKDSLIAGIHSLGMAFPEGSWTWLHKSVSSKITDRAKESSVSYVAGSFSISPV